MGSRVRFALIGSGLWKMRLFLFVAGGLLAAAVVLMMEPKTEVPGVVAVQPKASAPVAVAPPQPEEIRLNTPVRFDGANFIVANAMDFDLYDATVELDPGVLSSGWTAAAAHVRKKEASAVAAGVFQKSNGTRFNPERDEASYARVTARDKAGIVYRSRMMAIKALR